MRTASVLLLQKTVFAVLFFIGGCSLVPEWGKEDSLYGDNTAQAVLQAGEEEAGFPQIHEVPERPVPLTSLVKSRDLASGLASDRARARYTNEELRDGAGEASASDTPSVVGGMETPVPETGQKKNSEAPILKNRKTGGLSTPPARRSQKTRAVRLLSGSSAPKKDPAAFSAFDQKQGHMARRVPGTPEKETEISLKPLTGPDTTVIGGAVERGVEINLKVLEQGLFRLPGF